MSVIVILLKFVVIIAAFSPELFSLKESRLFTPYWARSSWVYWMVYWRKLFD